MQPNVSDISMENRMPSLNQGSWRLVPAALAVAALAFGASVPVRAQVVTWSGDVSPTFTPAPIVDLTGQRIFLGFTNGGSGTQGALSVTAGGSLTAAQIVPGTGGLGVGFVTVDGNGSVIHLTGGAAFNGLDIGSWGTGTVTVSNGGLISCASTLACAFNTIGNAAGSTGTLAINGGSVIGLGPLTVGAGTLLAGFGTPGASTSGTLTITNGGTLASTGYNSVANNSGQTGVVTGNVTIDGAGSSWSITRDLANGGGQAFLALAPTANALANVTVSNGGNLTVTGSRSNPATDNSLPGITMSSAAGATSTMTVTTGGSVRIGGDTGVLIVGGSSSANSAGANATLNITAGGTVAGTGPNGLSYAVIGRNQATGTINVSGVGSQLVIAGVGGTNTQGTDGFGALLDVGRNQGFGGGNGTLNVTAGGSVLISDNGQASGATALRIARGADSTGSVTVSGPGSSIVVSSTGGGAAFPHVLVGHGGTGQLTISNGGSVSIQGPGERDFIVGGNSTGSGTLNVTSGGQINASWFAIGNNGGSGVATINAASVNLDGTVDNFGSPIGAGVRVGRGVGSSGVLNLQNGAAINIDNSISSSSIALGGTGALPGGTGTLNMSGGSAINFTGSATGAFLQVGGPSGTGFMTMTGNSIVNMGATGSVRVGSPAASTGTLTIGAGSKIFADNGGIGGNSDTVTAGTGSVVVTGAGSLLSLSGDSGFLSVGRSGTGSLSVTNQGTVAATILNVGRAAGGFGTLSVDNAVIALSGQQTTGTLSGAGMAIGNRGGTGAVTVTNGSQINITNLGSSGAGLSLGGTAPNPLGNGTLSVSGGSTITVSAAPGLATFQVGRDGTGTAGFSGASSINLGDGNVYVGLLAGSAGTLTLSGGSTLSAGNVYIGGASDTVPGGTGVVAVTGAGSALTASGSSGFISVGHNGTGTLAIANQGTVSGTVMSVGRAGGGVGSLSVDNAVLNLSGQQTTGSLFGAALAIGNLGGTGSASITNGSVVTISNPGSAGAGLQVGGSPSSPLGTGTLTMSNSLLSVIAAAPVVPVPGQVPIPGLATVTIGHDGNGTATLANSTLQVGNLKTLQDGAATVNGADGSLIIAGQAGSTGLLSLNAGSVVKAGYIGIGVSQRGDGVTQFNGGAGHLILNDSILNTGTLEIGAQGILSGANGTVHASDAVIVGGILSPGNSPARIVIDCNLSFLAGSRLILDILDDGSGGYDVDHLILGPNAVFDFANVQVEFKFLGDTDPNAFLASGLFTLDTFLGFGDHENYVPLAGATGQAWSDLFTADQFVATSETYTFNSFAFTPPGAGGAGGGANFSVAAIPEPSTWAMMALGLLFLSMLAQRRRRPMTSTGHACS
jgi:T5SS/PEP-CTERM-associated repeat protein